MEWNASRDAVPEGYVQSTVYDSSSGERVATVFEREEYVALVSAAPDLLAALEASRELIDRLVKRAGVGRSDVIDYGANPAAVSMVWEKGSLAIAKARSAEAVQA